MTLAVKNTASDFIKFNYVEFTVTADCGENTRHVPGERRNSAAIPPG